MIVKITDGFSADFTEGGDVFAGVFATADMAHGKIGETDSTSYVYDGVAAHSRLTFEFSVCPTNLQGSEGDIVPLNISINMKTEVSASDREDVGRVWAYFKLEEQYPRKTLKYVEVETKTVEGEPKVFIPIVDELPSRTGMVADEEQIFIEFWNVDIKIWTRYVIEMSCGASAYSTFKAGDTSSEAKATIFIDPSFRISPDYEQADEYSVFIHSDMLESSDQPRVLLELEQDGAKVETIEKEGGPVTFTAPNLQTNSSVSYLWSAMNPTIKDTHDNSFDEKYTIDPSTVPLGKYTMNLITFPPQEPNRGSITFEVVSSTGTEQVTDTEDQGKGIPGFPTAATGLGLLITIFLFYLRSRKQVHIL